MNYVKPGDQIQASAFNELVSYTRKLDTNQFFLNPPIRMVYNPFDIISLRSGNGTRLKLQPSWYIDGNQTYSIQAKDLDNTFKNLDDYPTLLVVEDQNLYFNKDTKKLEWGSHPQPSKLLIIQSIKQGEFYRYVNKYPSVIDTGGSGPCPFGELTTVSLSSNDLAVRGGVIYAGDKNYNVEPYKINLTSNGSFLIYITLQVEVNRDDDNEIILPNIKTCSKTSITSSDWSQSTSTSYPNNTPPVLTSGLGTIIIPIASCKITDNQIETISFTKCGNITINQCGGTLSHSRG